MFEIPCWPLVCLPDFMTPEGQSWPGRSLSSSCCWGCCGKFALGPILNAAGNAAQDSARNIDEAANS